MLAHRHFAALAVAALLAACGGAEESPSDDTSRPAAASRATALAADWAYCTWEGGTCAFSGSREIRYGTATKYVTRTVSNGTACSNAVFGDPAPGTSKSCWWRDATTGGSTPPPPVAPQPPVESGPGWTYCASEGNACTFSGTRQVRYGTTTRNVTKTYTGSVDCGNAAFGDPAYGTAKSCWIGAAASQPMLPPPSIQPIAPPAVTPPAQTYSRAQIFALANPNLTAEAGQDVVLRVRFYGVRLPDQSKVAAHLVGTTNDYQMAADLMHHFQWVPSQSWSGYVEYDYRINIPAETPPGTYRIAQVMGQGVTPYVGRMAYFDCNGIARLNQAWATEVQSCHVGNMTVLPATRSRSTATDGPMGMFYASGRTWNP